MINKRYLNYYFILDIYLFNTLISLNTLVYTKLRVHILF